MRERVVLVPWNSLASAFILISTDIFRLKESMITIPQEVKQTNHMNPIRPVIPSLLCGTSIVTLCIMQINVIIQSSHQLMETQPLPSLWMTKCPWGQDIETHVFHIYFKSCTVWSADYLLCHCEDAAAVHWAARLLIFWADTPANKLVVALPLCLDGLYLPSNTSRFLTLPLLDNLSELTLVILSASHTAFILRRSEVRQRCFGAF